MSLTSYWHHYQDHFVPCGLWNKLHQQSCFDDQNKVLPLKSNSHPIVYPLVFSHVILNMSTRCNNSGNVVIGDVLHSTTSEYLVQSFVGQGTYGLVAKCTNIATNANVAIKIIKNIGKLSNQTASEVRQNSFKWILMHIVPFKSNDLLVFNMSLKITRYLLFANCDAWTPTKAILFNGTNILLTKETTVLFLKNWTKVSKT